MILFVDSILYIIRYLGFVCHWLDMAKCLDTFWLKIFPRFGQTPGYGSKSVRVAQNDISLAGTRWQDQRHLLCWELTYPLPARNFWNFLKVEYVIFFLEGILICCCFLVTRIFVTKSAQVEETNSISDQILWGLKLKKKKNVKSPSFNEGHIWTPSYVSGGVDIDFATFCVWE